MPPLPLAAAAQLRASPGALHCPLCQGRLCYILPGQQFSHSRAEELCPGSVRAFAGWAELMSWSPVEAANCPVEELVGVRSGAFGDAV